MATAIVEAVAAAMAAVAVAMLAALRVVAVAVRIEGMMVGDATAEVGVVVGLAAPAFWMSERLLQDLLPAARRNHCHAWAHHQWFLAPEVRRPMYSEFRRPPELWLMQEGRTGANRAVD